MAKTSFSDEVAKNKRFSVILAVVVSLFLFFLIYFIVYFFIPEFVLVVLPVSILFIVIYTYSSYRFGDSIVLSTTNAKPADPIKHRYLLDTVEGLSIASGIPAPKTYVIENQDLNAFATGRNPENASIAVTTGLIDTLNRQELEGVVAHEISHIKNRDILFMTLIAVLVGLAAILSHFLIRSMWFGGQRNRRDKGGGIIVIVFLVGLFLAVFAPIATRLVQFAVSRKREYLADASGVSVTRYPEGLASALEKIANKNQGRMKVSDAVSHLFFVDPQKSSLDSLFATHPPIRERIKKLRQM
ncbi:MAG: M48 family metalloprotease [Candidatus Bathyarchaeota archaeon]|nr:MAG: M48 family metalloprotease [Candidatus Bathyarchaeota archaeon]